MVLTDPPQNPELKKAALVMDYKHIRNHLPGSNLVLPNELSIFRSEEANEVIEEMDKNAAVIITGGKGIGKSCLLNLMEGSAIRNGRCVYNLNRLNLRSIPSDGDVERLLIDHANDDGFLGNSITDVVESLKNQHAILLIDELTGIFGDKGIESMYKSFEEFIRKASQKGIPMALVIHYIPEVLEMAYDAFPFLKGKVQKVPRYATRSEIGVTMASGCIYKQGEVPYKAQVLTVDPEAVKLIETLVGNKPILINNFIQDMYLEQQLSQNPTEVITPQVVQSYWDNHIKDIIYNGVHVERVLNLAGYYFANNEDLRNLFRQLFNLPNGREYLTTPQTVKSVNTKDIPGKAKEDWMKLGLIKEEGDSISIDGLLTAMTISRKLLK